MMMLRVVKSGEMPEERAEEKREMAESNRRDLERDMRAMLSERVEVGTGFSWRIVAVEWRPLEKLWSWRCKGRDRVRDLKK